MERTRAIFGDLALQIVGVLIGLAVFSLLSSVGGRLPSAYDAMFPVVRFGYVDHATGARQAPIQHVSRDNAGKACWSVYVEKLRPAVDPHYDFYADGGDTSAPIPTSAYLVDGPIGIGPDRKLISHKVGEQWHRRYCFDIAGRIPSFKTISISGFVTHDRFPHLWKTVTPLPTFEVRPSHCYRDDGSVDAAPPGCKPSPP